MDKIDLSLIMMLLQDSRTPYRDLAERLGLSVNAVHRRIQELVTAGVIKHFNTKIRLEAFSGVSVLINGKLLGGNSDKYEAIGAHEYIYWVSLAGDNKLYIGGYLPSVNDLDKLLGFLKEQGLTDTEYGIEPITEYNGSVKIEDLDTLDYQILEYLQNDARMNTSDIATELEVSARTVRRRVTAMDESGLIHCSLEWYPSASKDIISMLDIDLREGVEKEQRRWELFAKYMPNFLYPFTFINIGCLVSALVWTDTMRSLQELTNSLLFEPDIVSVTPNIVF